MRSETNNGTHNGTHKCYSYKRIIPISDILIRGVDCNWILKKEEIDKILLFLNKVHEVSSNFVWNFVLKMDDYNDKIYPVIEDEIIPVFKTHYNLVQPSAPVKINFTDNKINEFLLEKKKLDERLIHYKKIKNRWTSADSSIKIAFISITGILTISTSIFSGITLLGLTLVAGIIITSIFGGFNAIYLFLTEGILIGLTSKKKKNL